VSESDSRSDDSASQIVGQMILQAQRLLLLMIPCLLLLLLYVCHQLRICKKKHKFGSIVLGFCNSHCTCGWFRAGGPATALPQGNIYVHICHCQRQSILAALRLSNILDGLLITAVLFVESAMT